MTTYSRNANAVIRIGDVQAIVKSYDLQERYECELEYVKYFQAEGFSVPRIIEKHPDKLEILFEYIDGTVVEAMNTEQLNACVEILATVFKKQQVRQRPEVEKAYRTSLETSIRRLAAEAKLKIDEGAMISRMTDLSAYFLPSLFKDAKVSNWIFTNGDVVMIDFDYVRESFFFADLAQLINYQVQVHDWMSVLKKFLDQVQLPYELPESMAIDLYKMARVNSYLAAIRHNPSLPEALTRSFYSDAIKLLQDLKVLS